MPTVETEFIKSFVDDENIRYSLVKVGEKYGVFIYDRDAKAYYSQQFFDFKTLASDVYDNLIDKVKADKLEANTFMTL